MTFLFDIGNVLIGVDFPPFYSRVFGRGTLEGEVLEEFISLRDLGDTGKISKDDFCLRVSSLAPEGISPEDVKEAWNDIFFPIEEMWGVVGKLKEKGHRLILFSNTNELHLDYLRPRFSILGEFGEGHYSCDEGCLKPDEPFYRKAIERFGLVPEETYYLDDLGENVEMGEELGFQCHCYDVERHASALAWFEKIGAF